MIGKYKRRHTTKNTLKKFALSLVVVALVGCTSQKKAESTTLADTQVETTTTTAETTTATETTVASTVLGEKYVDLDKRSFAINGKVYVLGEHTLQNLIDDGVPFHEDDIANAGNNLNDSTISEPFRVTLPSGNSIHISVVNTTGSNQKTADCKIASIYIPAMQNVAGSIFSFTFPHDLTEEALRQQAGEPTKYNEYVDGDFVLHTLEYKVSSEKYLKDTGYSFEFVKGKLNSVTINWID
ncbi:MAG: hypothetical protein Q4A47_01900 [Erysipelotrichaceae bacterium]|nr:hypothetical protein [Erysipelotrichaceae bacterium]